MGPGDTHDLIEWRTRFDRDGFAIARAAIADDQIDELRVLCESVGASDSVSRRGNDIFGIRNLLTTVPGIREIVSGGPIARLAMDVLGHSARPVHGVFFDKTAGANWPVTWHQDTTIRVRQRIDVAGFESRPVNDGIVHMLPPVELSEQILALRIHLDDAASNHGALRVIPGSHCLGRLSDIQLKQQCANVNSMTCDVRAGDIMLMRPLLIHASSPCERPCHRRVIHIEYAGFDLPGGLQWHG